MPTDISAKTRLFTESVIREMTRRALSCGAVNLAQGFPDFAAPTEIKEAAKRAIDEEYNQYAITHGSPNFRRAIADKVRRYNGIACDPDRNITVTCGATEAMVATMLAVINPGDEVIIFEPFYENYGPDVILAGATPRYVALRDPDFSIDRAELEAAFGPRTKAIVINTPHNPSGKVFTRAELEAIAALCRRHDTLAITDEIYEHIIYGVARHISIATLEGMAERTVTISGLSKTYSITGWRLAYAIASERITSAIRKVHDFLTVGAPHPLQEAGAVALRLPEVVLCGADRDVRAQAWRTVRGAHAGGPGMQQARWCVLHRGGDWQSRVQRRLRGGGFHSRRGGSRGGAGFKLLSSAGIGASKDSIHVFEERRDDRGSRRAVEPYAGEAGGALEIRRQVTVPFRHEQERITES